MRHLSFCLAPLMVLNASSAYADSAHVGSEHIKGQWARDDGRSRVEISRCGDDWCAVNLWIKPGTKDEKAGDVLIMTLKPEADKSLSGSAYDPQRKLTYSIRIKTGAEVMTTEGCFLGVFCRSVQWSRL